MSIGRGARKRCERKRSIRVHRPVAPSTTGTPIHPRPHPRSRHLHRPRTMTRTLMMMRLALTQRDTLIHS